MTATYSRRSEITYDYGHIEKRKNTNFTIENGTWENKTKLVAWMVSNCGDSSGRLQYVKNLKKFISVDVFGACGPLKCKKNLVNRTCLNDISKDYYFYLSFENSICKEYVTEKLWGVLQRNIIPVVLGGANYSQLLPPNSYIDVANFSSPKLLANYLRNVARNKDLYLSYFKWKSDYVIKDIFTKFVCSMCKYLNSSFAKSGRVLPSWNSFWNRHTQCMSAREYFQSFIKAWDKR